VQPAQPATATADAQTQQYTQQGHCELVGQEQYPVVSLIICVTLSDVKLQYLTLPASGL